MISVTIILIFVFVIALFSTIHALGLWLFLMITHGWLVEVLGNAAAHLPTYCGLLVIAIGVTRRRWVGMPAVNWIFFAFFIALIALAALSGVDPASSFISLLKYSKGFLLAIFVAGIIKDSDQVRIVTLYCVAATFWGACIALYQHLTGSYSIDVGEVQRAGGLSRDPNDAALLLLTGLPVALYWFMHSDRRFVKLLFAAVFVLIIAGITLTQSRGGAVTLALILLFLFLRRPSVKVFSVGIVLVSIGLLFVSEDYWERMEDLRTIGAESESGSISIRYQFIEAGIDAFLRHPVLGVGMGNFGRVLQISGHKQDASEVAHNMYLEFFVENGTIAGLLFLILLGAAVLQSIRYDRYNRLEHSAYGLGFCISMSLMAVMIAGLFLSQGKNEVLWFFVGIGLALSGMIRSSTTIGDSQFPEIVGNHLARIDKPRRRHHE
jgi:O-antigen ligase